jgi:hypothetical protein
LLRQYFPKGTDLSVHSPAQLLEVATELNARPRKTLGGLTPAKAMQRLLFDPETSIVCDDRLNSPIGDGTTNVASVVNASCAASITRSMVAATAPV